MKISSISISAKANVEGDEESKESIFNKNMDEIVYFFEETRYRYVFFEDLDRLNDAAVLSEDVRKNQLLVFLLRRGYIDEKYTYYINYFKGSSITNDFLFSFHI